MNWSVLSCLALTRARVCCRRGRGVHLGSRRRRAARPRRQWLEVCAATGGRAARQEHPPGDVRQLPHGGSHGLGRSVHLGRRHVRKARPRQRHGPLDAVPRGHAQGPARAAGGLRQSPHGRASGEQGRVHVGRQGERRLGPRHHRWPSVSALRREGTARQEHQADLCLWIPHCSADR